MIRMVWIHFNPSNQIFKHPISKWDCTMSFWDWKVTMWNMREKHLTLMVNASKCECWISAPNCKLVWVLQLWRGNRVLSYREVRLPSTAIGQFGRGRTQWDSSSLEERVSWLIGKPGYLGQLWRLNCNKTERKVSCLFLLPEFRIWWRMVSSQVIAILLLS